MSQPAPIPQHFLLDPQVKFLNHGSFGATPRPVFEVYQQWQRELENQPVEFLGRRAPELLAAARAALADYLGTQADNLVYVTNATSGLNIVARSLALGPGDEVLTSNHEYGALDRTWQFLSEEKGFSYRRVTVPIPVSTPDEFVDRFWAQISSQTRIIFLSHITSPTALTFPVAEICRLARQHGILTVIDGAHVPGQIPLNLTELGADFYSGNLHKWLCAPKGAAFLYANPAYQQLLKPLIVSWGFRPETPGPSAFIDLLEWSGTRDLAAFLSVPEAIRFQAQHNWADYQTRCHELAGQAAVEVCRIFGLSPLSPIPSDWYGQMISAPLPEWVNVVEWKERLYAERKIEVPLLRWESHPLIRISFQAYNSPADLDALLSALDRLRDSHPPH